MFGIQYNMDYEKIWSVNDLVRNRGNWSLSADSELLKHLQLLSQNIFDKTRSTSELLESFERDVDRTCLSVANIGNCFKSLSDTQFIENKIQESPETELVMYVETKESRNKDPENVSTKLKEALDKGLTILSSHYDIITVSDSDSEAEEPQEILLKSCNPFINRRLPYIIGTDDFTKYDHLGLGESSSEDEEEHELADEVIEEEQLYDRGDILSKKNFTNMASTQIIQISSSDSDDSVISPGLNSRCDSSNDTVTTANNFFECNVAQSLPKVARSFADHLNTALLEADVQKPTVIADCGCSDSFSPPPFPVKSSSNFSSDDEKSDSGNSVSSRSSVISHSSPYFIPSPSLIACSNDYTVKSNNGISDDLFSNESSISKSVKYDEYAKNSSTLSTVGPNSGLGSDLICPEEKKLSRALADEFRSVILAKNNSMLPNRNSIECDSGDSKLSSKNLSAGNNAANVEDEKHSTTSGPFHHPPKDDPMGIDFDGSDEEIERNVSSTKGPHQSSLVHTVGTESSKRSWHRNNADDNDDNSQDEWFSRAVPHKISRSTGSVAADAFGSSNLPSVQDLDESSAEETLNDVLTTCPKSGVNYTSSVKGESVGVVPQTKKTEIEVEDVEKKYSSFGSEGANVNNNNNNNDDDDDDDDDYLFTKRATVTSDEDKTNELYEILFNDSDIEDPIQALVEENKRRVKINKPAESEIFNDSEIVSNPAKDCEIFDGDYSSSLINDYENMFANEKSGHGMPNSENESVSTPNVHSSFFANLASDVNHGTEGKLFAKRVTKTDENISSGEITQRAEAEKMFSDDIFVSDLDSSKNETSKTFRINVQNSEFDDANFEKENMLTENVKSESSENVVKSNFSAVENDTLDFLAKTAKNWKPGLDLRSYSDEPTMETPEKEKVEFNNLLSGSVNTFICGKDDKDQEQSFSPRNTNYLFEPSIYKSSSENGASETSSSIKNQVPSDLTPTSVFINQRNDQSASFNFHSDEFSPNASDQFETVIPSLLEDGSVTSEIIIHTDKITNQNRGISCERNIVKEETPSCTTITKPGKLAVGRGANVNINALLPPCKWSRPNMKKTMKTGEMMSDGSEIDNSNCMSTPVHSNLLSVTKNRTKVPSKRRPPTRRGRVSHLNTQSFFETSVADETELITEDLNESVPCPKSVTFCEPFTDKSTNVKLSADANLSHVVSISAIVEDTFNNISCVGTSSTESTNVDSIFDTIFCDDSSENIISNPALAIIDRANACNSSNPEDLSKKSSAPLTNPSLSLENYLGGKKMFSGGSENDFTSTLISDCGRIESSNLGKIVDSPPKSSLLSKSSSEDGFIVGNASRSNKNFKFPANSPKKTGPVLRIGKEQINSVSRTTKKEVTSSSVSHVKSDLFADDDDEDFNKLFSPVKNPLKNVPLKNCSLFADVDEDDEKLFGVKTPQTKSRID